ncbi:trinucleotide repeat-containing gene 18 protein-like, partial [Gracilinanus agilis]|uniref:trinucleotide repeat-containing gene 18 protein-like n=1 Tax=Gracilinanus agilis TaxID=191870 RepID=UPI001CFD4070
TEFEYTDSESEVKIRKKSPSGLLRGKKGLMEQGGAPPAPSPSTLVVSPTGPEKTKIAVEKGRKSKKLKSPKESSFEFGLEVSDDDLWNRRRSERIFLHDATTSAAALSPASSTPVSKGSRCGKGTPLSPRKEGGKAKERKELNKQKKKGKESSCCSSMSPPGIPSLAPESRASLTSSMANKKNKAKAKGKEVKKE